ncbi:Oidioi.mRNA.OKI2018_I69.chr1.g2469.t1.cds [Oikopleura dioica]|uniref:Oidioi.mRNA.OKI2018_I69.chr1.g2469.t1.cds n=1 Tax=Oikopleura dioica TaxID=34765 RepID=A0ABN7SWE5_OIKDI|nr:Oidioi.mRNA.OKI2018_I69.chr1.g2469.t1.cds [Oikopleura dioica]
MVIPAGQSILEGEITDRIEKRAVQLANEGRVAICLDNYDHQSAKYCGILLCTFGTEGTKCLRWFISFRRVLDCSDEGMRTHLREILAEYGLQDHYDRKVLPIIGDFPIQNAFRTHVAAACCAHTIANISKSFLKKCSDEWFAREVREAVAGVHAVIRSKRRIGCAYSSLNEEIKQIEPAGPSGTPLRVLEGLNFIRFRSVFNLFERLLDAQDFITSGNRLLYTNGHTISWEIVEYMVKIGGIFMEKINLADSDEFMVTDTLFTMQELLTEITIFFSISYIETSAATGENVQLAVNLLLHRVMQRLKKFMRDIRYNYEEEEINLNQESPSCSKTTTQ